MVAVAQWFSPWLPLRLKEDNLTDYIAIVTNTFTFVK